MIGFDRVMTGLYLTAVFEWGQQSARRRSLSESARNPAVIDWNFSGACAALVAAVPTAPGPDRRRASKQPSGLVPKPQKATVVVAAGRDE